MSILSDKEIRIYCQRMGMIEPFEPQQVKEVLIGKDYTRPCFDKRDKLPGEVLSKIVSYGTSSYGYDLRVGTNFKIFSNINNNIIDPKNFDPQLLIEKEVKEHEYVIIPPNSFALAVSVERFNIPREILTICLGKSTYARCGIIVNTTPFEPGWTGYPTLEISNTTTLPAKIYAGEGLAQVLFFKADQVCETSYADRKGKYQDQPAIPIAPKV